MTTSGAALKSEVARPLTLLRFVLLFCGLAIGLTAAHADLPATIVLLKPSVILVGTFSATDNPRFNFRGTGFVARSGNGRAIGNLAVTNAHVLPDVTSPAPVERSLAIQVWRAPTDLMSLTAAGTWESRTAKIIAVDKLHDMALLSFDGPETPAVKLSSEAQREGAAIAFMGFPIGGALGFPHVTHRGIISAVVPPTSPVPNSGQLTALAVQQMRKDNNEIIYQLDATAYPGNSGGPVFDPESGAVIGVINSVLVKGGRESALTHPSGISYAIPIKHAQVLLKSIE